MIGWIFRGCALAVLTMFVLFVLIILSAMGVVKLDAKPLAITFVAIAFILMGVPILIGIVIAMFFKKVAKEFNEAGVNGGGNHSPTEITLQPLGSVVWSKPSEVTRAETQLSSLGFTDAGEYRVDEIAGLKLHAMVKTSENAYAVVYDFPNVGSWVDLVLKYEDGTGLTVANSPHGGTMDPQPGHEKIHDKDADAVGLYEQFKAARKNKPTLEATAGTFKAMFEKAYRDEMAWRAGRGGPTKEEVKRVAALSSENYSDEVIEQTHSVTQNQARLQLEEILLKNFEASNQVSPAEWESSRDRVLLIHDQMTADEAVECLHPDEIAPEGISSPREAFAHANKRASAEQRCKLLGSVSEPVKCDVYLMPE